MCESSKEVAKTSFQLHYNYCVKNISKCQFCNQPVAKNEMEDHLEEMKGSEELARISANNGDFEKLKNMIEHGADILSFRDSAS